MLSLAVPTVLGCTVRSKRRDDRAAPPVGRVMRFRLSRRATERTMKGRPTLIGPQGNRALAGSRMIHVEPPQMHACTPMQAYACINDGEACRNHLLCLAVHFKKSPGPMLPLDCWDSAAWVDGLAMRTRSTEDRIGGSGMMSGKSGRKRDGEEREEWHWLGIVSR